MRRPEAQRLLPPLEAKGIYSDVDAALTNMYNHEMKQGAMTSLPRRRNLKGPVWDVKMESQPPFIVAERKIEEAVDAERRDSNTGNMKRADRAIQSAQRAGSSANGALGPLGSGLLYHGASTMSRKIRRVGALLDFVQMFGLVIADQIHRNGDVYTTMFGRNTKSRESGSSARLSRYEKTR